MRIEPPIFDAAISDCLAVSLNKLMIHEADMIEGRLILAMLQPIGSDHHILIRSLQPSARMFGGVSTTRCFQKPGLRRKFQSPHPISRVIPARGSAITLINGIADRIAAAGTDQAALAQLVTDLKADDDPLAAAIQANTPAAAQPA